MELLDIHSDFDAFEDYFERFEVWAMTKEDDEDVTIVAHFLIFIGKEAHSLLKTLALLWKSPFCFLHENEHKFGQCLSCGKFHSFNPCKFRNSKCFKCSDVGNIQSVCNTTVHLAATNIKSCNSDYIKLSTCNDHSSSSTISEDSVESLSSSDLNGTQNPRETTISNQSICQISHVIVPNMVFPNDAHIYDEISYKSEENMLSEHNYVRKPDVVLMDADFSNDPMLCNDILNKFEETISKESNLDALSNIICPHNAFVYCGELVQFESQVLNNLDFDYNSDDFISAAVYPYHEVTSNVHSSQCEKYVLNEATSFITWGYKDPTLFRGGG
ncbi:unnamed protein product [Schistosoma curassoni]|uniref:Gag-Pol polyprotein n=1 Tax=Schistosoma curassoni TaxID=6186 RepID=A0A183KXE6_9TREM|nr:unnamed protein product [Schistosoma curassoni]